jgi:hypothetical protein
MADNDIGTLARFTINSSSARNKLLKKVKTCKITDSRDGEHAKSAGSKKPVGVVRKPGGGTIELSVYEEKGTPEVDYYALQDSEEFFEFVREIVDGPRRQYLEVTVVNVAPDDDDDGNHMLAVKMLFSESKPL